MERKLETAELRRGRILFLLQDGGKEEEETGDGWMIEEEQDEDAWYFSNRWVFNLRHSEESDCALEWEGHFGLEETGGGAASADERKVRFNRPRSDLHFHFIFIFCTNSTPSLQSDGRLWTAKRSLWFEPLRLIPTASLSTYFGQMKTHRPARTGRMQHEAARLVLTHADHCTCRGNTLNEHNLPFFCS